MYFILCDKEYGANISFADFERLAYEQVITMYNIVIQRQKAHEKAYKKK